MNKESFVIKTGIGKKYLISLIISTIVLAACVCTVVSLIFRARIMERYEYVGFSVSDYVASNISGDTVLRFLETNEADNDYDRIRRDLLNAKNKFDLIYLYIAVPEDGHMTYLWEATSGPEVLNYEGSYSPGGEEWSKKMLNNEGERTLRTFNDPDYGRVATAASPIYDSYGNAVALAYTDFSIEAMVKGIRSMIAGTIAFVVVLMAIYAVFFYLNVKKSIVDPINQLTVAVDELIQNVDDDSETYTSIIHTGDEIEALSRAFEDMDEELRKYITENTKIVAEKERIGTELELATDIQAQALPSVFPPFPDRKEFDIYALMDPAKEVGGDFYDFFFIDDDHLGLVIADVSSKGIPAALFMMVSMVVLNSNAMMGDATNAVMERVNNRICKNNANNMFVTIWLGVLEISTGKLKATNAGHEYPCIRRANGDYEVIRDQHGLVVGAMEGIPYTEYELQLEHGDSIFVYTDGVPEAMNEAEELFGEERLLEALNKDPGADVKTIIKNVKDGIDAFVGEAPQFDDITMLALKFH